MTAPRDLRDYLADILQAAQKADVFLAGMSLEAFAADDKTLFAVVRALEVVGEAAKHIPQDFRDRYASIPWRSMAGIRDKLIHDYVNVNVEVVWRTVVEDLPPLRYALAQLLTELPSAT